MFPWEEWCQIPDFLSCMRASGLPGKSRLISFWLWAAEAYRLCKAIGYGVANEGTCGTFMKRDVRRSCLPIGVVLTIAAAGSEMSDSSVITKEEGWLKRGYSSNYARARFAVMNPELTMTLPKYQTASGCVDIMMHTMERYFNHSENMEMTDGISEHLLRTVMKMQRF